MMMAMMELAAIQYSFASHRRGDTAQRTWDKETRECGGRWTSGACTIACN